MTEQTLPLPINAPVPLGMKRWYLYNEKGEFLDSKVWTSRHDAYFIMRTYAAPDEYNQRVYADTLPLHVHLTTEVIAERMRKRWDE